MRINYVRDLCLQFRISSVHWAWTLTIIFVMCMLRSEHVRSKFDHFFFFEELLIALRKFSRNEIENDLSRTRITNSYRHILFSNKSGNCDSSEKYPSSNLFPIGIWSVFPLSVFFIWYESLGHVGGWLYHLKQFALLQYFF